MEVEQAIERLRTVRHFSERPLSDEDIDAILDAGRHAGSSKNLQRWTFIVVRDRSTLERLAGVGDFATHLATGAAAIALVTPDPFGADAPLSITWDLGRAAQNMMLVALARGIGSCPATVYDHELCRSILGIPKDFLCEYVLNFGFPASADMLERAPRAGGRRPLVDVARWERW